jgi:vitamin-K-epoxide reductase (warfarin-sensitive)
MVLNRFAFILSVFGIVVAAYMWSMHSHPQDIPCGIHMTAESECTSVALSKYSRFPVGDGPPVAMWGTFGYLALAGLAFLRTTTESAVRSRQLLSMALLLATGALGFALWLTYIELNVLQKICKWCMTSQGIIAGIFILNLTDWLRPLIGKTTK